MTLLSPRPILAAGLLVLVTCTACSAEDPAAVTASVPTRSSSPTTTQGPTPTATTSPLPTFDRTATPATTSGSLRRTSLPRPSVLGTGWRARIDPGGSEAGYTGNGTPTVARDPRDTVAALRPLGCAEEAVYDDDLPLPRHVLEVDYRHRAAGANAVGLALEFADAATAAEFFDSYARSLAVCRSGAGGTTRVMVQAPPGADAIATLTVDPVERTTWRELAELSGRVVRLLAVEGTRAPLRSWSDVLGDLRGT